MKEIKTTCYKGTRILSGGEYDGGAGFAIGIDRLMICDEVNGK